MEIYVNGVHYKTLVEHQERQELKKVLTDECDVALYHKPMTRVPSLMERAGDCRFLSQEEIWRHTMKHRDNSWLGKELTKAKSKREQILICLLKGDKVGSMDIAKFIKTLVPPKNRKGNPILEIDVSNWMSKVKRLEFSKHINWSRLGMRRFYQITDEAILNLSIKEVMKMCKEPGIVKLDVVQGPEIKGKVDAAVEVGKSHSDSTRALPKPQHQGLDQLVAMALEAGHEVVIKFKPAD